MKWKVIKTEADYKKAIQQTMQIFHAEEGTPEEDGLTLLFLLVKDMRIKISGFPNLTQ